MLKRGSTISSRHWKLKEKALRLRAKGLSYNDILKRVPVAKSTISLWCRYVKLTPEQEKNLHSERIRKNALKGIKAIQTMFWRRRCEAFMRGAKSCSNNMATADSKFLAGLMLYWAEGTKSSQGASVANSDPRVIKFMAYWFKEYFGVDSKEMKIYLHLHSGQNENKMKLYWSGVTGVPIKNFGKSFVKPEGSGYRKNILYNGTVRLGVKRPGSVYLKFQILGAINGFLNKAIKEPILPENWMSKLPHARP